MLPSAEPAPSIRLNRIAMPVSSLGYGQRVVIWVQGCTIACPGCNSRQTWSRKGGEAMAIDDLIELIGLQEARTGRLEGLTISGGEPTEQADAVFLLVQTLRNRGWLGPARDVLVYSGLDEAEFTKRCGSQLALFDAAVVGPFVREIPGSDLAGSGNQRLLPLSPLGQTRYRGTHRSSLPLEGILNEDSLLLAGIVARGETEQFRSLAAKFGIKVT